MNKIEFIKTIRKLRADFELNPDNWECKTIPEYLEAIENYATDIQGYYENTNQNINADIGNWKVFADIMEGASIYE